MNLALAFGDRRFHRLQQFEQFEVLRILRERIVNQREITVGVSRPVQLVRITFTLHDLNLHVRFPCATQRMRRGGRARPRN